MLSLASTLLAQDGRQQCDSATFEDLTLFGGEIINTTAQYHSNLTFGPEYFLYYLNFFPANITNLDVCEVNVTYTHPGQNDTINTIIWLPRPDNWNGRFMGVGGGGWGTAQGTPTLHKPVADGYAAIITDGGHSMTEGEDISPRAWGLKSPGNVDWSLLQDFASIALDDAATLGKGIVKAFYGRPQDYSYWSGCSTGGRQGYMMAQRYPEQYDGILASAPAINWNEFLIAEYWPQLIMNELGKSAPTDPRLGQISRNLMTNNSQMSIQAPASSKLCD
ncbi:MAG: tannase/feruloyl esterase family alpha/beta hydrolase [Terriglobus roseus]|nr:tannase/feruloyl esterase family alpha/beta hydrolase [Terriglobus roseus]